MVRSGKVIMICDVKQPSAPHNLPDINLYSLITIHIPTVLVSLEFQTLELELSPGFQPVLTSTQPNAAQSPLSEFFLQLGPEHHLLLQLKDNQVVTLRDFQPVSHHLIYFTPHGFG